MEKNRMNEQRPVARWLHLLGSRAPETTDSNHLANLRESTDDPAFALYISSFESHLTKGLSFGAAIAELMVLDLSDAFRQQLTAAKTSEEASSIMRDAAFSMLEGMSDHTHLSSILRKAGYRFSAHRNARGTGPTDIDLYTAMTDSNPNTQLTGETVNVSFTFTENGELDGIQSYSMGHAPANPLRKNGPQPKLEGIRKRTGPRRSRPSWLTKLATPARVRFMNVTPRLVEFTQGLALQMTQLDLDFEERVEIRGRTRPFGKVQIVEIGDGTNSLPVAEIGAHNVSCLQRLVADRAVKWCLHPMVSDLREDLFAYDCFISIGFPETAAELEAADSAYLRELAIASTQS